MLYAGITKVAGKVLVKNMLKIVLLMLVFKLDMRDFVTFSGDCLLNFRYLVIVTIANQYAKMCTLTL